MSSNPIACKTGVLGRWRWKATCCHGNVQTGSSWFRDKAWRDATAWADHPETSNGLALHCLDPKKPK